MTTTHITPRVDPDAELGVLARLRWALIDCWTIVAQELTHLVRQPSVFAWQIGTPIVMVLMFVYVFGSAMDVTGQGAGVGYIDFAMPGLFVMTISFGFMNTAYAVTLNKEKGFIDRFRSMPMSSSAVVTGRSVSTSSWRWWTCSSSPGSRWRSDGAPVGASARPCSPSYCCCGCGCR